jgi:hypothetical protein
MNGWLVAAHGSVTEHPRSDGNSQNKMGVVEQDALLAVGLNAKPSAGIARR